MNRCIISLLGGIVICIKPNVYFQVPVKIPTADVDDDELAFDLMVTRDLNFGTSKFENGTGSLDRRLSYPGRLNNSRSEAGLHEMDT
jgi:hypothetical protein